jgi:hypothetical protein
MATAAQIEANRRNAQKSTWPKTDEGKARARGNALKHGMAALTIMPGLPQEDPKQREERIQEWDSDVQPQNAVERDLVRQAARLSLAIERGERIETAHMARRVRMAGRMRTQKLSARRRKQVRELGRRLLYVAGPEEVKVDKQPLWADDPGLLVSELEESAEGCRWLLERWAEYRNLLDRRSKWEEPVLIRFIRLQGKQVVESVYDPALNSIFLAWDVLVQKYAKEEWESFREERPTTDPAYNHRLHWREIAPRPSDPAEAWEVLSAIVNQHVGRLKELLARNEAIEAAEDPDWADHAALDCSPAFERHRRYQSAKTRELLRTLDTLCKMRKAGFGMGDGEGEGEMADGKCQMADGKRQMADGKCRIADDRGRMVNDQWQMADDKCQVAEHELQVANEQCEVESGGCDAGESSEPMAAGSFGPVVGHDSHGVIEESTNDKTGILSHEGTDAADGVCQGDGLEHGLVCGVKTPQKAPNEAKLESTQNIYSQGFESQNAEPQERERSQSAAGGQVVHGAGNDRVETIVPADKCGGKARGRKGRSLQKTASATQVCSERRRDHP